MILREKVGAKQAGMRLDEGSAHLFTTLSKSRIRKIIDLGGCSLNGTMVRVLSRILREGDEIALGVMEPVQFQDFVCTSETILYEDDDLVGVCKPAGFNSQRTPYQLKGTVEYAVGNYLKSLGSGEPVRIVHRLDRGTSGVMLFPKNRPTAARLSWQLKEGRVEKHYLALVSRVPVKEEWSVDLPIAKIGSGRYGVANPGKGASTTFRVMGHGNEVTLVDARPFTGRTHQIRVHLAHEGFPIVGDSVYGCVAASRMMLHCRSMSFEDRGGRVVTVTSLPDDEFVKICRDNRVAIGA